MVDEPEILPAVQEIIVPGADKRGRGHPKHKPTEKDRQIARLGAAAGMPQEDIACAIGIDAKTLREHYRHELDNGRALANVKVAGKLYELCMQGNVAAVIYWHKTQILGRAPEVMGELPMVDITEASKETLRLAVKDADAEF